MPAPPLLRLEDAALLVVDVQERFRPVVPGYDGIVAACVGLVRTFRTLERPVVVSEQYPRGLGPTVPELLEALDGVGAADKTAFSALGCATVRERLAESGARSVVVCGVETHVCILQTVHDLLRAGLAVHLAVDAVGSRKAVDRDAAVERLVAAGAVRSTSETVAFEMLRDARHPAFKTVQAFFK